VKIIKYGNYIYFRSQITETLRKVHPSFINCSPLELEKFDFKISPKNVK